MTFASKEALLPIARAARLRLRYQWSKRRAGSSRHFRFQTPPVFVIGCGRSGTTILGELLKAHPNVSYLFEPYHFWTAVDSRTDMLHLYEQSAAACALSADDATPRIAQRFNAAFGRVAAATPSRVLVEKTPINSLRISYLDAIAPSCRFIHIVRDGVDVARSIERLATTNEYRIAGKPKFNQWWGDDDVKWRLLARDGASLGHHPFEAPHLTDHDVRGAYEWLVSLHEVNRFRNMLDDRLLEIRYTDLISSPRETLDTIASFMRIGALRDWLNASVNRIDANRSMKSGAITLPSAMADDFNELQSQYNFRGVAITDSEETRQRVPSPRQRDGVREEESAGQ